jgi:hypothetical protein
LPGDVLVENICELIVLIVELIQPAFLRVHLLYTKKNILDLLNWSKNNLQYKKGQKLSIRAQVKVVNRSEGQK